MKKIINTSNAPLPVGPYNQAVLVDNTLYISGQIAIDVNSKEIIDGTIAFIENRNITISQLMKKIPGPDFPTGGIIIGKDNLKQGYNKGRGYSEGGLQ